MFDKLKKKDAPPAPEADHTVQSAPSFMPGTGQSLFAQKLNPPPANIDFFNFNSTAAFEDFTPPPITEVPPPPVSSFSYPALEPQAGGPMPFEDAPPFEPQAAAAPPLEAPPWEPPPATDLPPFPMEPVPMDFSQAAPPADPGFSMPDIGPLSDIAAPPPPMPELSIPEPVIESPAMEAFSWDAPVAGHEPPQIAEIYPSDTFGTPEPAGFDLPADVSGLYPAEVATPEPAPADALWAASEPSPAPTAEDPMADPLMGFGEASNDFDLFGGTGTTETLFTSGFDQPEAAVPDLAANLFTEPGAPPDLGPSGFDTLGFDATPAGDDFLHAPPLEPDVPAAASDLDLWGNLDTSLSVTETPGEQFPTHPEAPAQFLSDVTENLYPEDPFLGLEEAAASAEAFEEAAQVLFPETAQAPVEWQEDVVSFVEPVAELPFADDVPALELGAPAPLDFGADLGDISPLQPDGPDIAEFAVVPEEVAAPHPYADDAEGPTGELELVSATDEFPGFAGDFGPKDETGWENTELALTPGESDLADAFGVEAEAEVPTYEFSNVVPLHPYAEEPAPVGTPVATDVLTEPQWVSPAATASPAPQISMDSLQIIGVCPLNEDKRLLMVESNGIFALMGQSGDPHNPTVSVIKTFDHNPLQYQNTFTAVPETVGGQQDMFVTQVGTWHGIITTLNQNILLHTELG